IQVGSVCGPLRQYCLSLLSSGMWISASGGGVPSNVILPLIVAKPVGLIPVLAPDVVAVPLSVPVLFPLSFVALVELCVSFFSPPTHPAMTMPKTGTIKMVPSRRKRDILHLHVK